MARIPGTISGDEGERIAAEARARITAEQAAEREAFYARASSVQPPAISEETLDAAISVICSAVRRLARPNAPEREIDRAALRMRIGNALNDMTYFSEQDETAGKRSTLDARDKLVGLSGAIKALSERVTSLEADLAESVNLQPVGPKPRQSRARALGALLEAGATARVAIRATVRQLRAQAKPGPVPRTSLYAAVSSLALTWEWAINAGKRKGRGGIKRATRNDKLGAGAFIQMVLAPYRPDVQAGQIEKELQAFNAARHKAKKLAESKLAEPKPTN